MTMGAGLSAWRAGLVPGVRYFKMSDSKDGIGTNKEVDMALSAILAKVHGVKSSLSAFVGKMEHEQLTWPSVLDSFSALSGHTNNLMKQLNGERLPPLHTRVILPLMVSSDKDMELERQTEGRVPMMHHEVVPNYLRTKLGLDLETKQKQRWELAEKDGAASMEKIRSFNKMLNGALERVNELKEVEERRTKTEATVSTLGETKKSVAAYLHGTGLQMPSSARKTQLTSRMQMPAARNMAMRAAMRSDQRQMVAAPYQTSSPHKQPR